jgi:hypothetical protein
VFARARASRRRVRVASLASFARARVVSRRRVSLCVVVVVVVVVYNRVVVVVVVVVVVASTSLHRASHAHRARVPRH